MSPLVYFVRHGQTSWNAEYRLQGQADTDMTDLGRSQAARNGRRLAELLDDPARYDYVASPLRRTRETMEIIRAGLGLPVGGYRTDPRLVEVHFGDWQGLRCANSRRGRPGRPRRGWRKNGTSSRRARARRATRCFSGG